MPPGILHERSLGAAVSTTGSARVGPAGAILLSQGFLPRGGKLPAGGVGIPSGDLSAKGLSLILLAFFFPLAIYLLLLGVLNRRRHPLLVSGVWDGIGLLFGVSGFLLFAGPAIFSGLSERWRLYWLLGRGDVPTGQADGAWQFWIFLSVLYFVLVVGGATFLLWRQRHLTAIYNAEVEQVEAAVEDLCERLHLQVVRSDGLFLFGLSLGAPSERRDSNGERIQAPHYLPAAARVGARTLPTGMPESSSIGGPADPLVLEQAAILELDSFPFLRHVTLRWDPADSRLRTVVEKELSRSLAETPAHDSVLGGWLLTFGCLLLAFEFLGAFVIFVINITQR